MSDERKDLPPVDSPNFLQKVREALSVYLGNRGNALDRGLTVRDLADAGVIELRPGYGANGNTSSPVAGPGQSITTAIDSAAGVDLTPPPTPTGFTATPAISNIVIQCDRPTYQTGHGHQKCRLYGSTAASPVFANAALLMEFPGNIGSYATNPSTTWHLWLTWVSNDGVESLYPAGGINGVVATTGANVSALLTALTGQIANTQLDATLTSRINLIDGGTGLAGSVNARIDAETTTRIAEDNALATSIATLSAGVGEQFDFKTIWYFDTGVDGFTGNGTPTSVSGWLRPANATGPYVESPTGIGADGNAYSSVKLRIRKYGTTTWGGYLWWRAAADSTWDTSRRVALTEPTYDANGIGLITVSPGWAVTVDRIRIDLSTVQDATNYFTIDWIAVGRPSPGASVASVSTEAIARASETGALFAQYTVKTDVAGLISGYGLASTASVNDTPSSYFGVRANRFYIAPPATASASAPVSNLFKGYTWLDTSGTPTLKYYDGAAWTTTPQAYPFIVQTTTTTIGGVTVNPGVYMDAAYIENGTITNAKIANAAIDNAKITDLSATKITAGTISTGEYIQSSSYVAGTSGWKIDGAGTAEYNNIIVRGTTYSTAGLIGGITIASNAIRAGQTAFNSGSGFFLGSSGVFSVGNSSGNNLTWDGTNLNVVGGGTFSGALSAASGTFAGALSAATGTFAGSLSAATGTFAGSLSAATGTFSGSLTASAVNAVDTINLAGQAVTIPVGVYTTTFSVINASTDYQTITFTSTGAPCFIIATAVIKGSGMSFGATIVVTGELHRDGFSIGRCGTTLDAVASHAPQLPWVISAVDTPGAGSHTYSIYMFYPGVGGSLIGEMSILVLELKK